MDQLIVRNIIEPNGRKTYRCLACGNVVTIGRRRYCSLECRKRLLYKLDVRTGLIKALNTKYATFYFSDVMIIMDMLPYGSEEIFSFFYPRSPGKKPAEDFSTMADMLGNIWWAEKKRTNKRYVASNHVLEQAVRNNAQVLSVKPTMLKVPSIKAAYLSHLKLDKSALKAAELQKDIKDAYRRQAKIHHPDIGGDTATFRKIHQAYMELITWAKKPTYIKRRGFPDKWFYDGSTNKWTQPTPGQVQR
ncbi:MAG: DnaJ domain-containing protein [Deltaproteobacteria bacterium]|nr:DnaJ domain-containing protein [Deltaproteobacteria bacterium]